MIKKICRILSSHLNIKIMMTKYHGRFGDVNMNRCHPNIALSYIIIQELMEQNGENAFIVAEIILINPLWLSILVLGCLEKPLAKVLVIKVIKKTNQSQI